MAGLLSLGASLTILSTQRAKQHSTKKDTRPLWQMAAKLSPAELGAPLTRTHLSTAAFAVMERQSSARQLWCKAPPCVLLSRRIWCCNADDRKYSLLQHRPELQRRLDQDPTLSNICVLGIDPGSMPTNLTRRGPWIIRILMFKLIMPWLAPLMAWLQPNGPVRTLKLGARDVITAGLDTAPPLGESPKGMYFYGSRVEEITPEARDVKKRERLWVDTRGYVQLQEGETVLKNWS